MIADFPKGVGPFPAVVLAPGAGTTRQPLNEVVSAELKAKGFAVYRFEWARYVKDPKARPSETDRAPEVEDFIKVIAAACGWARVEILRGDHGLGLPETSDLAARLATDFAVVKAAP